MNPGLDSHSPDFAQFSQLSWWSAHATASLTRVCCTFTGAPEAAASVNSIAKRTANATSEAPRRDPRGARGRRRARRDGRGKRAARSSPPPPPLLAPAMLPAVRDGRARRECRPQGRPLQGRDVPGGHQQRQPLLRRGREGASPRLHVLGPRRRRRGQLRGARRPARRAALRCDVLLAAVRENAVRRVRGAVAHECGLCRRPGGVGALLRPVGPGGVPRSRRPRVRARGRPVQ